MSTAAVAAAFKKVAVSAGVSPANYSTHSIRIGGATALMNGTADSLAIKHFGHWVSNCYEDYSV